MQSKRVEYNFQPLESLITSWVDKGYYPGAAICVVKDNQVIFQNIYGEYTADTKVYVASAGKWVAAAVIGAVVDRTDLDWDDRVDKWIPEFIDNDKGSIPLRYLLSHTSGVMPYLTNPKVDNYNSLYSAMFDILPLDSVFSHCTRIDYVCLVL